METGCIQDKKTNKNSNKLPRRNRKKYYKRESCYGDRVYSGAPLQRAAPSITMLCLLSLILCYCNIYIYIYVCNMLLLLLLLLYISIILIIMLIIIFIQELRFSAQRLLWRLRGAEGAEAGRLRMCVYTYIYIYI